MVKPLNTRFSIMKSKNNLLYLAAAILIVLAGVITGWKISGFGGLGTLGSSSNGSAPGAQVLEKEVGITDESTFKDSAEGTLEEGGLSGEGTHHLVRGADESKYVALTSTVIDLDSYVGKKVMIWGQSLSSEKATWLMDVGKLRVTE